MTAVAQLQLDVGTRQAAPIERVLLAELDYRTSEPCEPDQVVHRESLIEGIELLLDFLATADPLPDDPLDWPCSACKAAIGQPCDLPDRRDKWVPPGPRYHLDRGLHGRWGSLIACS